MLDLVKPTIAPDEPPPAIIEAEILLVARAQRDSAAFAPLYDAYFDAVYRYCFHRLGSWEAAEDAASLVFTNALAALPRYRTDARAGSFRSWLFVIAHNVVANYRRAARQHPVQPLADAGDLRDATPSPEEMALSAEASHVVQAVLQQLPHDQRRVLELRLAGLTGAEISQVLGRTQGAIRTAQYRASTRLPQLVWPAISAPRPGGGRHDPHLSGARNLLLRLRRRHSSWSRPPEAGHGRRNYHHVRLFGHESPLLDDVTARSGPRRFVGSVCGDVDSQRGRHTRPSLIGGAAGVAGDIGLDQRDLVPRIAEDRRCVSHQQPLRFLH
jgi:RNA polymerase sigma-70 factor (ECF subfamily)